MDNQNLNGMNGNNVGQENMNPITPNPNLMNQESVTNIQAENNTLNEEINPNPGVETIPSSSTIENVEPVKPTLDSILNGNDNEMVMDTIPNMDSVNVAPVNSEVEVPIMDSVNNTVSPTETIPNDTVGNNSVDSTPIMNTENGIQEEITPLQTESIPEVPIVETPVASEPIVNNSNVSSTPVVETIEPTIENVTIPDNVVQTPVENLENVNEQPIEVTELPTIETPTIEATPIDDFHEVPIPPVFENEGNSKKEGNKKPLILILILLLIVAIGLGVYYFLLLAKNSVPNAITTNDVKVELGSTLSQNIDDYATIKGYNKANCTLNLNNVDINKVSTYKYTVTCGKVNAEGIVIVDDSTKPEVITNDLTLLPNSSLKAEDFIEECIDASECSYEFKNDVSNLTKNVGNYEVEIVISDAYNNQNTVTAKLTVATNAPARYLTCKKAEETLDDISATLIDSYKIGIDSSDNFHSAIRKSEFKFNNSSAYNNAVNNYSELAGIHNIIGNATYNANNNSIILKANKTLEDMNKELNGRLPNNSNILRAFLSGLGYICN